jgi:hypothetical protein
MFVVIEFTNYRKEQEIIIHGYSSEVTKAVDHAKQLCSSQVNPKKANDYIHKIENLDDCENLEVYINLTNAPNSVVLHKFFMTEIERTTNEQCESICKIITEHFEISNKNDITLHQLLDYFDVSQKNKDIIKEDYCLDDKIGHDNDMQRYFIDYLKMNNYAYLKDDFEYETNYFAQVFGVVQIGSL